MMDWMSMTSGMSGQELRNLVEYLLNASEPKCLKALMV
jgi:hypothetical protein